MKKEHVERAREELNCLLNLMNGSQFPGRAHAVRRGIESALAETNRALARPRWLEVLFSVPRWLGVLFSVPRWLEILFSIFGKKQERGQA